MKQETGKTNQSQKRTLSIQISLSGQCFLYNIVDDLRYSRSFSITALCRYITNNKVSDISLYVSQKEHVSILSEVFKNDDIEIYLNSKSIEVSSKIICNEINNISIIFPVYEKLNADIAVLNQICEVNICHNLTVLICTSNRATNNCILFSYVDGCMCVIAKKDNSLVLIEAFELSEANDIIDFVEFTCSKYSIERCTVNWLGRLPDAIGHYLKKNYKTIL